MLGAAACPWLTLGSVSSVKFPFHSKGRRGLLDRHVHSPASACQHSHPAHPAMGDFTACPELKHKYGNCTGRQGIPVSSRLKNNSRFMKHKGKFTNEQGLSRKALKQGRQCLCLPKCRKMLGSCRTLCCFVQAHAMLNPLPLKI